MNILHLSDLHFGTAIPAANPQTWYGQLAEDLKKRLKCNHLDLLIISGDIANKAIPS